MAIITPRDPNATNTIKVKTSTSKQDQMGKWWLAQTKKEKADQLVGTAAFLKEQNAYRIRKAANHALLYGNKPLYGPIGSNYNKLNGASKLPINRPTMSVITSCIDTLTSRLTQSKPRPEFLTDNGDYKQRKLAKELNAFIAGELYQTRAYSLGELVLRDAEVFGTGVLKVLEDVNKKKVALERRLAINLLVDANECADLSHPTQLYEMRLVDRAVLAEFFPKYRSTIEKAEQSYPDTSSEAGQTVSDQIMVFEGWHLPSSEEAGDGAHAIACSEGLIFDEKYTKDSFPFAFLHYSPEVVGFWGQGLAEQLFGTQMEINTLLSTISQSINLVGVPRVFVEDGSKVVKAHLNNSIGSIVTYRGTKPQYEVAPCVPQELYAQLQRLVEYAYQQSGISALAAASKKPTGITSGTALREYDDLQTDRFAALEKRYDKLYIDLAYQIIDKAKDIAERDGKYQTIYPNKDGTKEIDLPASDLLKDPFVIECYDTSSLPRDPAGRLQKVVEMMQAGLVTPQEGRRLLDYPDIEQVDKLANAAEERILQILDEIVEDGKYTPPDPFMDIQLATTLVTQYYNLYVPAKLEEERAQMLRDFFSQLNALKAQAMQAMGPPPGTAPQAVPQAPPVSDQLPNVPGGMSQ